jgi:NAD(P)-dependent dehydrogenase (short-subunit alcohol dehydrogenase family)
MQLEGNVFAVTGGASGLGLATARRLGETIRFDGAIRMAPR